MCLPLSNVRFENMTVSVEVSSRRRLAGEKKRNYKCFAQFFRLIEKKHSKSVSLPSSSFAHSILDRLLRVGCQCYQGRQC